VGIATEAYQERKEELVREAAAKELTAKEAALSAKEAAQEVKNAADKAIQAEREKDVNLAQEKTGRAKRDRSDDEAESDFSNESSDSCADQSYVHAVKKGAKREKTSDVEKGAKREQAGSNVSSDSSDDTSDSSDYQTDESSHKKSSIKKKQKKRQEKENDS